MPCSAGYAPVAMDEVAAGVIDGKIETDDSCIVPYSTRRWNTGSRPVLIAGQTACGVAASMTMRRTLSDTNGSVPESGSCAGLQRPEHQNGCRASVIFYENLLLTF